MKTIKFAVLAIVSAMLVIFVAGCQSKKDKMTEFLYRYGNVTIEDAYKKAGFILVTHEFKMNPPEIKSVKTKDSGGVVYHFVKVKAVYDYVTKSRQEGKEKCFRWMALTIEEDGFGNMLVDLEKSKEVLVIGINEKDAKDMYPEKFIAGENLLR
ncbi:MAG: hypothetical protein PHW24_02780 [Candidatus Moranbacteria bacterium]|jgi:hypothetical protein|nr:hypothetical protein [Candidatus Moranbacteria bacterium]